MKIKLHLLILGLLVQSLSCFAQKEDVYWIFGDSVGVNFSNLNNPTAFIIPHNISSLENYNSIADKNGNLLFYMTGYEPGTIPNTFYFMKIFNSQHLLMENSDSILTDISETQGTIFIPFPNEINKYYVFHKQHWTGGTSLYYSIIDLSFNNGLGKVVSKNNLLSSNYFDEKLIAVKHGNGLDWWIITHLSNSDKFNIYLINSSGISTPINQSIGPLVPDDLCSLTGQMKATKQGDKIVFVNSYDKINLFDFDRCSGVLSNYNNFGHFNYNWCIGYYGCSFSSSGNRLYVSKADSIFQYNLEASSIQNSEILLWVDTNLLANEIGQHQLGPDGKIYVSNMSSGSNNVNLNLSVINYPDSLGIGCNFSLYSFNLAGGHSRYGLPNLPNYALGALSGSPCDTIQSTINLFSELNLFSVLPNPANKDLYLNYSSQTNPHMFFLYNYLGKAVLGGNISEYSKSIPIETLPDGIYFWKMIDQAEKTLSGKIIIQH